MQYSTFFLLVLLLGCCGFLLLYSLGCMYALLSAFDMLQFTYVLAVAKVVGGVLLIWSKTRTVGVLFNVAYFGGAIATHVVLAMYDFMFGVALVVMALLWAGFFLTQKH